MVRKKTIHFSFISELGPLFSSDLNKLAKLSQGKIVAKSNLHIICSTSGLMHVEL